MSKGVKAVLGVVAAIAVPFIAPVIAGAIGISGALGTVLGSTALGAGAGSALVGAGLGAGTAALTGRNPLLGAALGGFGGFAGGGGLSGLFGGGAGAAASAPASTLGTGATAAVPAVGAVGAPLQLAGAVAPSTLGSIGSSLAAGINPSNLAQLALVMYGNSNTSQLDAAQQAALRETAELARTNQELFSQRVADARRVAQLGTPNPEQAFAQTEMGVQRRLAEVQRGSPFERQQEASRRAQIEGTRLGVFAANQESARANQAAATAAGMLPTQAPLGAASMSLPIYQAMQKREDEQTRDIARAVGNVTGPTRQAGLFTGSNLFG